MFIWEDFRKHASELLKKEGITTEILDAREEYGDFTYPTFPLAKEYKKSPAEIAGDLASSIEPDNFFSKIEAIGPYVNFHIKSSTLAKLVIDTYISDELKIPSRGKIIVEHTSANPTGPLHIGRTRNSIIGDTMARILKRFGYDVEVHYFVNDVGKQVAILLWGILNLKENEDESLRGDYRFVKYYQKAYKILEKYPEKEMEIQEILKRYESGDPVLRDLAKKYVGDILKGIEESLNHLNIHFDRFVWESSLIPLAKEIPQMLEDYISEENGAYYLDMKKIGFEGKDKFYLYRKDGTTLYFLRDIAYHLWKSKISKNMIDVLGEDHKLHFKAIRKVMEILEPDCTLDALFYSFVRLPEGKMSTRKGQAVYLDDLLKEGESRVMEILKTRPYPQSEKESIAKKVSRSAIRFHIVNMQEDKPMVFRWEKALSFDGESGPFIQYTYARASGILRKSGVDLREYNPETLTHPEEIKLLKLMAKYGTVIMKSVNAKEPHLLAKYAYDLASQFNQFYRDCPVITADDDIKQSRLALVKAFKNLIGDVIETLGMDKMEKM